MKITSNLTSELIVIGATARLEDLNKQREALIKIIEKYSGIPKKELHMKHKRGPYKKRKKLHWTQTPEGKRKMSLAQKKIWALRRAS